MSQANKSIQEKTNQLTKLVAWFDSDDFSIEEALDKYKTAEKLAAEIEKDLSTLKNEINIVKNKFDSEK
ncbi:MAG: exodeoxyribonuclease VII small subunit [Candidatus Saccharibacteria bacterium]|nr:exodeoxyribonuclease VII small subunit [Candidatus Saccharibacteria bacterium]